MASGASSALTVMRAGSTCLIRAIRAVDPSASMAIVLSAPPDCRTCAGLFEGQCSSHDLIAFVVALLARLRRDRPDQAHTCGIACSRSKSREAEVGRAGGVKFRDGLVGIVGCHRKVDASRLEVTLRRSQEQCAVFAQPLRADDDTLLRIGRERQTRTENKNRNRESNHACRLAEHDTICLRSHSGFAH
jgi:hypothetical protein